MHIIKSGIKELKNNKALRSLALDLVIVETIIFFITWTYQIYLEFLGITLIFFGLISSTMTITEIFFTDLVPKFQNKDKKGKYFLWIYTLIPGIAFILLSITTNILIGLILILIIVGFGFSRSILFISAINRRMEGDNRSTILSTINMLGNSLKTVTYLVVGILVSIDLNMTYIILGIIIVVVSLISGIKNNNL